jgi:hypothetical protein
MREGRQVIVLPYPEWWFDHVGELVDAPSIATQAPEGHEPHGPVR